MLSRFAPPPLPLPPRTTENDAETPKEAIPYTPADPNTDPLFSPAVPRSEQVGHLPPRRRRPDRARDLGPQHLHLHRAPLDASDPSPRHRRGRLPAPPHPPPNLQLRHLGHLSLDPVPPRPQRRPKAQAPPTHPPHPRALRPPLPRPVHPRPQLPLPPLRARPRLPPRARRTRHLRHLRGPPLRQARPAARPRAHQPRRAPPRRRARRRRRLRPPHQPPLVGRPMRRHAALARGADELATRGSRPARVRRRRPRGPRRRAGRRREEGCVVAAPLC